VRADCFEEDDTRFVWYPYIPIGDYTVLMAEGGAGKTMFCCGIAATISRRELLPGDTVNVTPEERNILFITAEDRGSELKKRLRLSGAVLSRIYIVDCMRSEGLSFADGMDRFLELLKDKKPCLVIIDPWHAFLGANVDINRVNALRPVLQKLANAAKECECGMILISHVNKRAQGENANNAAVGSADLINAARSAMKVARCDEPGKQDLRVVVHTKSNYAPEGRSVLYTITDGGGIRWSGFSDISRSVLEAAARCHQTPFEYLENKRNEEEEEEALLDAIRELAQEGKTVNVSYKEMEERYGDAIFGSGQPKKMLDRLIGRLSLEGIILTTGKSVKHQKKACNGFSLTKKGAAKADPDSVA
jgi:RecA-family ATPase